MTAPARPRRRRAKSRPVVCLISANPLALPELHRMAARARLRTKRTHLDLNSRPDAHEVRVPHASVYVLDGWSTGPMTEAVVAAIRARHPTARLVVLIRKITETVGFSLLQLGVKGLVAQKQAETYMAPAIAAVAGGGVWIPRDLIASFLDRVLRTDAERHTPTQAKRLSARERQVLDCVLKSQSNKEIGVTLNISESTVKFHLTQLFQKFGVRRRADLILQSIQQPATLVH
jgi:DNA-binding NarL/FixJ family response regulator